MNGRLRKFGLAGILVGGTLLFGVGFAGAQSPSSGSENGTTPPKAAHSSADDVMTGGDAGHGGCGGHGGATTAVASEIDL